AGNAGRGRQRKLPGALNGFAAPRAEGAVCRSQRHAGAAQVIDGDVATASEIDCPAHHTARLKNAPRATVTDLYEHGPDPAGQNRPGDDVTRASAGQDHAGAATAHVEHTQA